MAKSEGKRRVIDAATEASAAGWEPLVGFNIIDYLKDTIAELYRLIERAGALAAIEPSRGHRRQARKTAWGLRQALRELGEDSATISAAVDTGAGPDLKGTIDDLNLEVVDCAARRRAETALGTKDMVTAKRAYLLITAMDRLEAGLVRQGVPPVERAPERVGRSRVYAGASYAGRTQRKQAPDSDWDS